MRCSRSCVRFKAALVLATLLAFTSQPARADTYQTPEAFVTEAGGVFGKPQALWLTGELQAEIRQILGHRYQSLRLRYWRDGRRTIWVLEEIGKEKYITLGFVVDDGAIADSRTLVFRESRGWEIKFPAFARQFVGARLDPHLRLDRDIDGITGATLSVGAYRRLARLALLLHARASENGG